MSYCRVNNHDSDVYVFGSGKFLECFVAYRVADAIAVPDTFMVQMNSTHPERTMLRTLLWLKSQGARVPDRAIERLQREADEREIESTPPLSPELAKLVIDMEAREAAG